MQEIISVCDGYNSGQTHISGVRVCRDSAFRTLARTVLSSPGMRDILSGAL